MYALYGVSVKEIPMKEVMTRKKAKDRGLKFYYTGKPCLNGHLSKRQVTDCSCYECKKNKHKEYYKSNPKYYLERSKKWRTENPDYHYKYNVKWRLDNKSRCYANNRNYYHRKTSSMPLWADIEEIHYVYELARERGYVVDHIVPLVSDRVCGLHTGDNLRVIPAELNAYKGNRYWPDMP